MTIIVSVKINDGIVMASDSASTFANGQIYLSTEKIVGLVAGKPVGAMITGSGGIGFESFATMMKDLRERMADPNDAEYRLPEKYTVQEVAERALDFLTQKAALVAFSDFMLIRVCGYSHQRPLAEAWDVILEGTNIRICRQSQSEDQFGLLWEGQREALDRLIFGLGSEFPHALIAAGIEPEHSAALESNVRSALGNVFAIPAMPIQEAIDLARFLTETTVGFVRFSPKIQPKTVGGPIKIAAITKHEGFRWVQQRPALSWQE